MYVAAAGLTVEAFETPLPTFGGVAGDAAEPCTVLPGLCRQRLLYKYKACMGPAVPPPPRNPKKNPHRRVKVLLHKGSLREQPSPDATNAGCHQRGGPAGHRGHVPGTPCTPCARPRPSFSAFTLGRPDRHPESGAISPGAISLAATDTAAHIHEPYTRVLQPQHTHTHTHTHTAHTAHTHLGALRAACQL